MRIWTPDFQTCYYICHASQSIKDVNCTVICTDLTSASCTTALIHSHVVDLALRDECIIRKIRQHLQHNFLTGVPEQMHAAAGWREISLGPVRSSSSFAWMSRRKAGNRGEEERVCSPCLGLALSESVCVCVSSYWRTPSLPPPPPPPFSLSLSLYLSLFLSVCWQIERGGKTCSLLSAVTQERWSTVCVHTRRSVLQITD